MGTRASTRESPDHPDPVDENLLEALGTKKTGRRDAQVVTVEHDSEAITRYVTRRLEAARDSGVLRIDGYPPSDTAVIRAAQAISGRGREFLFARLAIYEILADPTLLNPSRSLSLTRLLARGDHKAIFAAAAERLTRRSDSFLPLLEALALARGRGLPIRDGIWSMLANALMDGFPSDGLVTDADISALLSAAQPYIAVDADHGQTVYRLAHRTFVEHFLSRWES